MERQGTGKPGQDMGRADLAQRVRGNILASLRGLEKTWVTREWGTRASPSRQEETWVEWARASPRGPKRRHGWVTQRPGEDMDGSPRDLEKTWVGGPGPHPEAGRRHGWQGLRPHPEARRRRGWGGLGLPQRLPLKGEQGLVYRSLLALPEHLSCLFPQEAHDWASFYFACIPSRNKFALSSLV